jgi:hypothetical protein
MSCVYMRARPFRPARRCRWSALTITAHVNHPPRLQGDPDDLPGCEFVLTHTTHAVDRDGWEQQHYNVTAYGSTGVAFLARHQAGQVIVITSELDLPIVAHRIITVDGPLNPAASAAAPDNAVALQHTALGPVPHTS